MFIQLRHFCFQKLHPSWSFYAATSGIIVGVALALLLHWSFITSSIWLAVALLVILFAIRFCCRISLVLAVVAGLVIGNFRPLPDLASQAYFTQLTGATVTISGTVAEDPDFSEGKTTLRLQNLTLPDAESISQLAGTAYIQLSRSITELERSDTVTLSGKLSDGFGTFVTSMYRPELLRIERADTGDLFARLKQWFATAVRQFIASPEVDLGLGYLVGLKSGLPETLAATLQVVGMTHVVVASGAHLGILINAAKKLFGKLSKFAGLLFSLLLVLGFVMIVGFTPSMTRAALVTSLSLLVGYAGRKFTPLRLILLVAAVTLLLVPTNLLNLGWQLSFASFFGILVLAPRLQRTFYGGKTPPWLASMLITSFSTSLICAPILIYNFGSISLLSFVANLFILPTLPYAMLLVFCTGITSFLPALAGLLGRLATWLLDFHIWLVNFLSTKTMFIIELPPADMRIFWIYLLVLIFLCLPNLKFLWRKIWPRAPA